MRSAFAVLLVTPGLLVGACLPDTNIDAGDAIPPRVVGVSPGARAVRTTDSLEVRFSEPMSKLRLTTDYLVIAETSSVTDSFISDLNNPPLSRAHLELTLAVTDGSTTVRLTPVDPMPPSTELTLVISEKVSDENNNPLVGYDGLASHFRYDFVTDDGAPQVVSTDLPGGNPAEVPPNLRTLVVEFDQPVYGVNHQSLNLVADGAGTTPEIQAVELNAERTRATLRLGDLGGACYTLCPAALYTLRATSAITDEDGVPLVAYSRGLQALPQPDLSPPRLTSGPLAVASEDSADIRWETDEPSTSVVRIGDSASAMTRRVVGVPASRCEGSGAARRCAHVVVVDGLDLGGSNGRTYYYAVESLDAYANPPLINGPYPLTTQRLPRLVLNEVYPNPMPGPAGESEPYYEFIEIFNASESESYDLAAFSLRKLDGSASMNLAPMASGGPTTLAPGNYAVVGARDRFDAVSLGVPQAALLLTDESTSRTTLLSGIENSESTRKAIGLFQGADDDPAAPLVTSYSAPAGLYNQSHNFVEGVSAERLNPDAPDLDSNWCHSRGAPTAGRVNTVFGLDACP
ncbi:MAG: Ig-like domain-containing protein [Pseudomonadota bacterium]